MRGRKPTPTALKLVRGNPGKRPLNDAEPAPPVSHDLTCPDWLSDSAKEHWPAIAQQFHDAGLLTVLDVPALALYCESFARWKHANEQIARYGPVVKGAAGYPVRSPYLCIANRAHEQMVKLLIEFGATPSSRSRCAVTKQNDPGPYAKFVKRT